MHPAENANAPVTSQGECNDKLEGNASKSETSFDYKRAFLELKISTELAYALHAGTPEGVAAATGARLIRLLRERGITAARLEFSTVREAA